MGRRKAAGRAEGSTEPTRKSRRLHDREQSAPAAEKKKVPPKTKKVKEVAKAKPEEAKKEESKTNEETPAENGDAKAEEPAAADKTDENDGEAEKDGKTE
ncbi:unnamed protein product [Tetraodon nigroviridis]|uniref:(spotted green pufferfish) hypothetical protein n=1 Tax=Tetraodon nigroviridis TaxID=99883 RepID=Q4T1N0_TETNG|nr:unnamed protein product [Tetraodon nigroviridis]